MTSSSNTCSQIKSYAQFASRKSRSEEEAEIEAQRRKYEIERKKQIENNKKLILTPKGPKWIPSMSHL